MLKIQIFNREWPGHLPMNNWNRKSTPKMRSQLCEPNVFPFIGKWLHHSRFKIWILSRKWVHGFCLPDSLKSFPLKFKSGLVYIRAFLFTAFPDKLILICTLILLYKMYAVNCRYSRASNWTFFGPRKNPFSSKIVQRSI